jgi:hypothetical protein
MNRFLRHSLGGVSYDIWKAGRPIFCALPQLVLGVGFGCCDRSGASMAPQGELAFSYQFGNVYEKKKVRKMKKC